MFVTIYFYWIRKDLLCIPGILSSYCRKMKSLLLFLALSLENSLLLPCVLAGPKYVIQFICTHILLPRSAFLPLVYLIHFCSVFNMQLMSLKHSWNRIMAISLISLIFVHKSENKCTTMKGSYLICFHYILVIYFLARVYLFLKFSYLL